MGDYPLPQPSRDIRGSPTSKFILLFLLVISLSHIANTSVRV